MRSWVLLFVCITCVMGVCNDEDNPRESYLEYSLDGATCKGSFNFKGLQNSSTLDVTALLVPGDNNSPEVVIVSFQDYALNREVLFTLPVGSGVSNPYQLVFDSDFGLEISHQNEGWLLLSGVENTIQGVSIDVKKLKRNAGLFGFGTVEELEVSFVGKMRYKNIMNETEEHTVIGNFYYR